MASILEMTTSNIVSRMNLFVSVLIFHWILFTCAQLTMSQHWFRAMAWWLKGNESLREPIMTTWIAENMRCRPPSAKRHAHTARANIFSVVYGKSAAMLNTVSRLFCHYMCGVDPIRNAPVLLFSVLYWLCNRSWSTIFHNHVQLFLREYKCCNLSFQISN